MASEEDQPQPNDTHFEIQDDDDPENVPDFPAWNFPTKPMVSYGNSNDKPPKNGGNGTREVVEVIQILQDADIPSCLCDVAAVRYFGAPRLLGDFTICVPTPKLQAAAEIFKNALHDKVYEPYEPYPVHVHSLLHTYPRFKYRGVGFWFILIPSEDCHFECEPANFELSLTTRIPYPKLEIFAQSLIDTNSRLLLEDLIDGMNLTLEWGEEHLDLSGTFDLAWTRRKNELIKQSVAEKDFSIFQSLPEAPFTKREIWEPIVESKARRIGFERPPGMMVTRYRGAHQGDPRLSHGWYA